MSCCVVRVGLSTRQRHPLFTQPQHIIASTKRRDWPVGDIRQASAWLSRTSSNLGQLGSQSPFAAIIVVSHKTLKFDLVNNRIAEARALGQLCGGL